MDVVHQTAATAPASALPRYLAVNIDKTNANAVIYAIVSRPTPCILDDLEYMGFVHGQMRWQSDRGRRLNTWDSLHGEVEVFNARGKHLGVVHAVTGDWIKDAVPGRSIDV